MEKPRTVIVTGGNRGIGAAISRLFAQNGYNVLVNFRNSEQEAMELQRELVETGLKVCTYKADVSKKQEVIDMVDFCMDRFGSVDILVNNAGVSSSSVFDKISEEEWDEVIDINLKGVFNCCQAVVPGFIRKKCGVIINISSIWGMVGASCEVHYSAAKAGVIGLTKALAKELGASNIRVNCVAPGIIQTDMLAGIDEVEIEQLRLETPLQKIGTGQDVAKTVFFLASEGADFITGQILSPNGGFVI